jgi:type II secretory pathway predicted ATPase ExeA
MYNDYFDLLDKPYDYIIPNPRFFYYTPQSQGIKTQCDYIVGEKSGHLFISGPIGAGKTTLLKTITQSLLSDNHNTINFINAPNLKTSNSLMRRVADGFSVKTAPSYDATLENFTNWLKTTDKFPILIIDEGQNLVRDSLKTLHYLMTYVTDHLLLMIILCGQEDMVRKIDRFPEIRSRMFPAALSSLTRDNAEDMMRFRWTTASKNKENPFPFTKEAIDLMFNASKGIPRSICQIADVALLAAYNSDRKTVDGELATIVIGSLFTEQEKNRDQKKGGKK